MHNYGEKFSCVLGLLATGIQGNEPILTSDELDRDLFTVQKEGLKSVLLYRLGGLNNDYLSVIKQHIS